MNTYRTPLNTPEEDENTPPLRLERKTARKTAKPPTIPQPNGKGALYAGGVPGNQGGTGRPPSSVKALLHESFTKRIPMLEEVADDKEARAGDRIRAIEVLGTFDLRDRGEGDINEHPEARRFLAAFHTALTEEAAPAIAERVRRKIEVLMRT